MHYILWTLAPLELLICNVVSELYVSLSLAHCNSVLDLAADDHR
jgi:hypothetical protein